MAESLVNDLVYTLAAPIPDAVTTTLTVSSPSGIGTLPGAAAAKFRIRIENEILLVTNRSGSTWTVTRGVEGTTAASHSTGTVIFIVLTAGGIAQYVSENGGGGGGGGGIGYDTFANRPTPGVAGKAFFASNGEAINIDDGSLWRQAGPIYNLHQPPVTGWTNLNVAGSSSVDYTRGYPVIKDVGQGGSQNLRGITRALSAPYTITALVHFTSQLGDDSFIGIGVRNSSTGSMETLFIDTYSTGVIFSGTFSNPTTFSGSRFSQAVSNPCLPIWFQIQDDGTHRTWRYGYDGFDWIDRFVEASVTGFDQALFFLNAKGTSSPMIITGKLLSWDIS